MTDEPPWQRQSITGVVDGKALDWSDAMAAELAIIAHRDKLRAERAISEAIATTYRHVREQGLLRFAKSYIGLHFWSWWYGDDVDDVIDSFGR